MGQELLGRLLGLWPVACHLRCCLKSITGEKGGEWLGHTGNRQLALSLPIPLAEIMKWTACIFDACPQSQVTLKGVTWPHKYSWRHHDVWLLIARDVR